MKTVLRLTSILFISSLFIYSGCKKSSGGGGGGGTTEANLIVTTNPPVGSVQSASNGPFDLTITITSAMPSGGVKIVVNARKDDGTNPTPFFTTTIASTKNSVTNISITGTPAATAVIVDITVTSLSKPSNVWTGTYRYSSK